MEFKIGDKVKIIKNNTASGKDLNLIGKIVYTVKFDKEYDFTHNGGNKYKERLYRRYINKNLELVKENNMNTNLFANGNFIFINSKWGVIVDNIIIYENGQYDFVKSYNNENFTSKILGVKVEAILNHCNCFNAAKTSYARNDNIIYKRKPFDREKWINDHYQNAIKDKRVHITYSTINKVTFCIDLTNSYKLYVTKCRPADIFNPITGIAIVYAKYLGEEIPKEI